MEQLVRVQLVNQILQRQVLALIILALLFSFYGWGSMTASVFGSTMALANTLLIKWHLHQAAKTAGADANKNLQRAYLCVAQRWLLTIALFAIGFALLKLKLVPLVCGLAITHMLVPGLGYFNRA